MVNYKVNELVNDSFDTYRNVDAVNASFLKAIKTSPLTALNPEYKETDSMKFGSLYHKYVLEKDDFYNEYFVFDEAKRPELDKTMASTKNKAWKNELLRNSTKILAKDEDIKQADNMRKQLFLNNDKAQILIDEALTEVSLYTHLQIPIDGTDEIIDLPLKCRFDGINIEKGYILDLKTTTDASPFKFPYECAKYGYHIQSAFYAFLAKRVFKKNFDFYFIAQEKTYPYNSAIYKASSNMIQKGEAELVELLPMATRLRKSKNVNLSYEVFCPNKNGIFELDVFGNTNPREFYYNGEKLQ